MAQHPVHSVADAIDLLIGLEMHVRGAAVDGVEQDLLDVFDDRCIVDFDLRRLGLGIWLGRHQITSHLVVCKFLERRSACSHQLVDQRAEFGVLYYDGLDVQPALKLDLVSRRTVGGIGYAYEKPVATSKKRHRTSADQRIGVDVFLR